MFVYQSLYGSHYVNCQAAILCQRYWIEPELAFAFGSPHMDMRRLTSLV
jgi:hypothetical protein